MWYPREQNAQRTKRTGLRVLADAHYQVVALAGLVDQARDQSHTTPHAQAEGQRAMLRLTFALPTCSLHVWGFASPPQGHYLKCNMCGVEYAMDGLRGLAAHESRLRGDFHIHVYCCTRPSISGAAILQVSQGHSGTRFSADPAVPEQPPPQPDDAEREPAVCRWCKGAGKITVNFKTKPCDCVKQEDTGCVGPEDDSCGWDVLLKDAKTAGLNQPVPTNG